MSTMPPRRETDRHIRSNVGLQLANIAHQSFNVLTKYKFDGAGSSAGQATYRSRSTADAAGGEPGHGAAELLAVDAFVEKKVTQI